MAWIKTHPHLLVLILVALAVLGGSAFVLKSAQDFDHNFDVVRQKPTKGTKVAMLNSKPLEDASAEFQKPTVWTVPAVGKSLFVSVPLMVKPATGNESAKLVAPEKGFEKSDNLTNTPIPNEWFFKYGLSPFKNKVEREDGDGDGFWNEDEFRAGTNPSEKDSHPPYITRLFFVKYHKIAFLLTFKSINGDPKKPEELEFQINTQAMGRGSKFVKLGETVPGNNNTTFKLEKFESKLVTDPNGIEKDVSELTLVNTETNASIILVLNRTTDSPDSIAQFQYLWKDYYKPVAISIRKSKSFALPNEPEVKYILLDIDDTKAVVQLPSGEKRDIVPTPAGYPPK